MKDYEFEPQPGLPEPLPKGEHVLWQGAPRWRALVAHVLPIRLIAAYFSLLAIWRGVEDAAGGASLSATAAHAFPILLVGLVPIALMVIYAWFAARSTLYTITDKRVVMRFGLALPIVLNLPFTKIKSAAVAAHSDGTGDIPLAPHTGENAGAPVSYLLVWPHIRPMKFARPEPMLRCIPDPGRVAQLLADALANANAQTPRAPLSIAVSAARGEKSVPASAASATAM